MQQKKTKKGGIFPYPSPVFHPLFTIPTARFSAFTSSTSSFFPTQTRSPPLYYLNSSLQCIRILRYKFLRNVKLTSRCTHLWRRLNIAMNMGVSFVLHPSRSTEGINVQVEPAERIEVSNVNRNRLLIQLSNIFKLKR